MTQPEEPRILTQSDETKVEEPKIPKWRQPKPVEEAKPEPSIPKWRRPKTVEEAKPETSESELLKKRSTLKPTNSTASDDKPSTSNGIASKELPKNKALVTKSSSSEAVDAPDQKPKLKKKKRAIPPIILADSNNGVENGKENDNKLTDTTKPPRPQQNLSTETHSLTQTSDSDVPPTSTLTVPQDKLLTTATSATSESDVNANSSPKPKKKIVRRKKKVPKPDSNTTTMNNGKTEELPKNPLEINQSNTVDNSVNNGKRANENVEPKSDEDPLKPKKKIVRKKKVVKNENEEPKLNGVESTKTEDSKLPTEELMPKKVFSKSRLYGSQRD